jgi:hypothetical protein
LSSESGSSAEDSAGSESSSGGEEVPSVLMLDGEGSLDQSGWSVSNAGDVNGDGLTDVIVGAPTASNGLTSGRSYVVFGTDDTETIQLSDVAEGNGGFALDGEASYDRAGQSVSGAGDVNGDGLADLIVGAVGNDAQAAYAGRSYVVFGRAETDTVLLSEVAAGNAGFPLDGAAAYDFSGASVSGAGDVNGDGLDDLIVGTYGAAPSSYVVFGKADTSAVFLSEVGVVADGFKLDGETIGDDSGFSVSGAGDVNADGLADVIVGARRADANGDQSGRSYVVFGKADAQTVRLSEIAAGTGGFALDGEVADDYSGWSVSGAGDVNGDGMDDVIVGAPGIPVYGPGVPGRSYVVFGKVDGDTVQLSQVTAGIGGFALDGEAMRDYAGWSVSGAGDVNGDGLADVIVGAMRADPNGDSSGRSYVVFGKADTDTVLLSEVAEGVGGFIVDGESAYDLMGMSVSDAGDFNGDGFADVIVGAYGADPNDDFSGRSYVVFG